jgi:hypothetical protein
MRKSVDQILAARDLSGRALANFLQFRHPNPLFCNVAQHPPRRYRYMSCRLAASRQRRPPKIAH